MNVELPKVRMTVPQFLDWGLGQEGQFELVRGEVVSMSPEQVRHNLAKGEVFVALREAVARASIACTVFTHGVGIVIDGETCREPDASVQLGPVVDADAMTIDAPIIVVEVTSPSSVRIDEVDKRNEYFSIASVVHYIVVSPQQRSLVHHRRVDGDVIEKRILRDGDLILDPPGLIIPVAKLLGRSRSS